MNNFPAPLDLLEDWLAEPDPNARIPHAQEYNALVDGGDWPVPIRLHPSGPLLYLLALSETGERSAEASPYTSGRERTTVSAAELAGMTLA